MNALKRPWLWLGIAAVAAGIYLLIPTDNRLPCQKEVTTFAKWQNHPDKIQEARQKLRSGDYRIGGKQTYSRYMPSDLNGSVSDAEIAESFAKAVGAEPAPGEVPLTIDYRLIENDKYDPNKKNPPKKAFSGYIVISFKLENTQLYRIQIDYLDPKAADLPRRVECAVQSFLDSPQQ